MCLLIQAHTFRGLKSPGSLELELCYCPSAGHYLPSPHFHAASFPFLSQCHPSRVGGEVAAILDSLKETGKKKISPRLHQLLLQYLSVCAPSQTTFASSVEFVKFNIYPERKIKRKKIPSHFQWWETGQASLQPEQRPRHSTESN